MNAGILYIQVVTPWFKNPPEFAYFEYDGNKGTVSISTWFELLKDRICKHHPAEETGDPFFDINVHCQRLTDQKVKHYGWWKTILHKLFGG